MEKDNELGKSSIYECEAKENASSSPTGYGGGIFLTGNGNYNPSTKRIDLKGMKIFENAADNGRQSLYVVMTNIKEWCQYGNDAENGILSIYVVMTKVKEWR
ncbi:MAG: hypothetical protein EZS28_022690 [Streblomastix strix]|uniref:Uncharacterized protein n=1 Tax=Streblomastix strix TaxID=222440 RepID=A0A5J4VHD7_9EUKA|nr:MAG: hypothetical protein EZS28_022690 [Streblomastix strix]